LKISKQNTKNSKNNKNFKKKIEKICCFFHLLGWFVFVKFLVKFVLFVYNFDLCTSNY